MKSAFGCTGEKKNCVGAAAYYVPCWWMSKNLYLNDLCAENKITKIEQGKHTLNPVNAIK